MQTEELAENIEGQNLSEPWLAAGSPQRIMKPLMRAGAEQVEYLSRMQDALGNYNPCAT